ncbi:ABC transporter ATP-binding protein [Flindersiella endophytica]
MSAVVVQDLRVTRGGREVLHDLSFEVAKGSVTGLLGPNGSGKTTLLRCVVGVQIVAGGTVTVLDAPAGSAALRDRIGYATQNAAVYRDLSVLENLRYFAAVLGAPAADIARVLEWVSMQAAGNQTVGSLSGGQLSRTSLAVALLGAPDLVVLDEPTVGLDPVTRRDLWTLFHELARSGVTLLVSSHVMDEAAHCDRLLLLRDGLILADDTPDELRSRTGESELEQAFLRLVEDREVTG